MADLQRRVLEAVAQRWAAAVPDASVPDGPAAPAVPAPAVPVPARIRPEARAVDRLAAGLAVLEAAVPAGLVPAAPVGPVGTVGVEVLLARVVDVLGAVGDAARIAAAALTVAEQEGAAEVADGLMTAAQVLGMLAELERGALEDRDAA